MKGPGSLVLVVSYRGGHRPRCGAAGGVVLKQASGGLDSALVPPPASCIA